MTKIFHVKIQVKVMKVDALLDSESRANLIIEDVVKKLGVGSLSSSKPISIGMGT